MAHQLGRFDVDVFHEHEALLCERRLEEVMRHAAAEVALDVEEAAAADSTRPTIALFVAEPWR